jgi:hypothetical protein
MAHAVSSPALSFTKKFYERKQELLEALKLQLGDITVEVSSEEAQGMLKDMSIAQILTVKVTEK